MKPTVLGLSIDCTDAATLAAFWSEVLHRPVSPGAGPAFAVIEADGPATTGPRLVFHQVPEPKTAKNRLHLDLRSTDFPHQAQRLLDLGATRVRDVEQGTARWTTFWDPEGNEFDLVAG